MALTVLYVVGVGHSGSTLLGSILEQAAGVACLGELHQFPKALGDLPHECSCGALATECSCWRAIAAEWRSLCSGLDVATHVREAHALSRQAQDAVRFRSPVPDGDACGAWCEQVDALYDAAASVRQAETLVDCSKHVGRAALLAAHSRHDIRLLHLIRDPRGVAWSHRKQRPPKPGQEDEERHGRSVLKTVRRWNRDNNAARKILSAASQSGLSLRYESLVSDPDTALRGVEHALGVDLSNAREAIRLGAPLTSAHAVAGNTGVRRSPVRALTMDQRWRVGLTFRERLTCRLSADPRLMWHFGY